MPSSHTANRLTKEQRRIEKLVKLESWGLDSSYLDKSFKNPLYPETQEDVENPLRHVLRIMRQPKNFYFTCKHVLNKELAPFQLVILDELWHRKYPMLIASRGAGKSFLLAIYAILRALVQQGTKIIVVGAAFRQAKVIFEYAEAIWDSAPILRDMVGVGGRSGPRRDVDRCTLTIGDSVLIALPLGDGTKIRGQRAQVIIADEFACLDGNTIVETNNGLKRIKNCSSDTVCINKDGMNETAAAFIKTPKTDVYEIITANNYSFKCSDKHSVMTMKGWKLAKDLQETDYLVFDNKYKFPEVDCLTTDLAWLLGVLVSEGSVADIRQIGIKHTDKNFIDRVNSLLLKLVSDKLSSMQYHPAYIDKRGWLCKENWNLNLSDIDFRNHLHSLGLDYVTALDKCIPDKILCSSRRVITRFFSGLFEGDGSCFLWKDKQITNKIGVAYYTASIQLARDVQNVLRKMGYISSIQSRKSEISNNLQYVVRLNGKQAYNLAIELNIAKWSDVIQNCYEKDIVDDDVRVVWDKSRNKWKVDITICGHNQYIGRFTNYEDAVQAFYNKKPVMHLQVKTVSKLDYTDNLYDFYLPDTNSFYANGFIQHNSIPKDTYEEVVSGFGSTKASPIVGMKDAARKRVLQKMGQWTPELEEANQRRNMGNQAILSGTASYAFNHFADYWKEYKGIIESKGDPKKLAEAMKGKIPPKLNWRNYSIIRLPVEMVPEGYMDEEHVARHLVTTDAATYQVEYGAVFALDSNGFFLRSIIERATVSEQTIDKMLPSVEIFHALMKGRRGYEYIFGVDTASEDANFVITVLELHANHRRTVYCWSTNREKHLERIKQGTVTEKNYYAYCARKIRDLMKSFNCVHIAMDAQGGGRQISEALHDTDKIREGEVPIWEIVVEDDPKWSDDQAGLHILELVEFSKATWVSEANHGLKKDLEDKILLFPYFDTIKLWESNKEDKEKGRIIISETGKEIQLADTLEDAVMEIEETKNELTTIQHTQTPGSNRDHWDTPETKKAGGRKGRLRKDRYSALLLANMAARQRQRKPLEPQFDGTGGFAKDMVERKGEAHKHMPFYQNAPDWFNKPNTFGGTYGVAVKIGKPGVE